MSEVEPGRVLSAICSEAWAIRPEMLGVIIDVARRQGDVAAVEARLGRPLKNAQAAITRDGVAILDVLGPIFPRANMMTEISGATSLQILARDLTTAVEDPKISAILMTFDSPGGRVGDVAETAAMIRAATQRKPVVAYVSDQAASAAYWLASAASRIVTARTATLGSIGVVAGVRKASSDTVEIVSSQSPHKRVDPTTDEGRAPIQTMVDRLAQEFVSDVAKYRGTSEHRVLTEFGRGGSLVGADAVAAGMADAIGSFEAVLAELAAAGSGSTGSNRAAAAATKEIGMTEGTEAAAAASSAAAAVPLTAERVAAEHGDIAAQFRAQGAKSERERVLALVKAGDDAPGHAAMIRAAIEDGQTQAGDLALRILAAERETRAARLDGMRAADAKVQVPDAATATGEGGAAASGADPLSEAALQARWDSEPKLRDEFAPAGGFKAFAAATRATARGQVRLLSRRSEGRAA